MSGFAPFVAAQQPSTLAVPVPHVGGADAWALGDPGMSANEKTMLFNALNEELRVDQNLGPIRDLAHLSEEDVTEQLVAVAW